MFKFSQLKKIHLEITNNCQASCPMCSRNTHGGLENSLIKLNSWSLEDFKSIMTKEVLEQINFYYFCGNFGDPILNNDLLEMCAYAADTSPNTAMAIHTNGSARNAQWWENLAKVLPKDHRVVFALDGVEDTHSLYRIGTDFYKILENAQSFINAGGIAEWAFIRFKHNEHQVTRAKQLAEIYGFKYFTTKDSSRFLLDVKYPVYNKGGNTTHYLEPSGYSEIKFIDRKVIDNYKQVVANSEIECYAAGLHEIYIDAYKNVFPCCWIAMIPYVPVDIDTIDQPVISIRKEIIKQYNNLIKDLGGIESLHSLSKPIKLIINSPEWQTVWEKYWSAKGLITCARSCGKTNHLSKPIDQFISKDKLQQ